MIATSNGQPAIGEAERGTVLWLVRALALLRAAQTLPWLTVVFAGRWETYRHPGLVVGLYVGYLCGRLCCSRRACCDGASPGAGSPPTSG